MFSMTLHQNTLVDRRTLSVAVVLLAWLLLVLILSTLGVFAATAGPARLAMPVMIVAPVAGFILLFRRSAGVREYVTGLDTGMLVILHGWRMLGVGFLFLHAHDVLPGLFAWLAGVGDGIAAVGAVLVGTRLLKGMPVRRSSVLAWNTFGLLDFIVAVAVGTALRSGNAGAVVSTDVMGVLPLSVVPLFIVPFYVITHLIVFIHYRNSAAVQE